MEGKDVMLELYLDESGNTGANFMDVNQPYFIYGGWLLEKDKANDICGRVQEIFSYSKAQEIKSNKGLRYDKCKQLFHMMMYEFNAIPIFGVADKKYMIAAKIVETFFDHFYNPYVNGYLTFKSDLKKALADNIFLNKKLLSEFSKIIRNGTMELETMREVKKLLSLHFEKENLLEVQRTINNLSDSNLQEMIGEFESISKNGTQRRWLSLVSPILMDRILHVDMYSRIIGKMVNLYVDELWGYQDVFDELSDIFNKKRIIMNVEFVGQQKSTENSLIQAADYLCGFVFHTLLEKETSCKNDVVNELWQDFIVLDDIFQKHGIKAWDYYANSDFKHVIWHLAGYPIEKRDVDSKTIIKRDFAIAIKK